MKKLLAALLAILVTAALAGCGKPAEEQLIDDATAAETFSETTKTSAEITEADESVSDTKTSDTGEINTEISAETENIFADYDESQFPMGNWQDNHIFRYTGSLEHNIDYIEISDYYN